MMSLTTRLERVEVALASQAARMVPVFIERRGCADRDGFAQSCRGAAGDVPCIVILPQNEREAGATVAASTLHLQPGRV